MPQNGHRDLNHGHPKALAHSASSEEASLNHANTRALVMTTRMKPSYRGASRPSDLPSCLTSPCDAVGALRLDQPGACNVARR